MVYDPGWDYKTTVATQSSQYMISLVLSVFPPNMMSVAFHVFVWGFKFLASAYAQTFKIKIAPRRVTQQAGLI